MDEADPFPNIFNLKDRIPESWHNYTSGKHNESVLLEYCRTSVRIHKRPGYVEVEINHNRNIVRLIGFRVEKRMVFLRMDLPAQFLMGLGERNGKFKINTGKYTLWSKDNLFAVQREEGCQNTYSYHPMILYRDVDTKVFELLYIRSTSALEIEIEDTETGKLLMTNMHGNSFEMLLFNHPSAKRVVEMYHEYLGGYKLPPLWYFGFHQSRWGYQNVKMISNIVKGYNKSSLKLESVFLDIDYMKDKKPFHVDTQSFPLDKLLELKAQNNIKIVPIVDFAFNFDFHKDLTETAKAQLNSSGIKL